MDKEQKKSGKQYMNKKKSSKRETLWKEKKKKKQLNSGAEKYSNWIEKKSLERFKSTFKQVDKKEWSNIKKFEIINSERQKREKKMKKSE